MIIRVAHWLRVPGLTALALLLTTPVQATSTPYGGPTPQLPCDSQSLPETGAQGRVPKAEVDNGRAARGYTCNTALVGQQGNTGGFRVERYIDAAGHECAFYDSTLLFPTNLRFGPNAETGAYVLDMTDHAHPVFTTSLTATPAMLSPHESLRLNQKRGLLVADMGYPTFNPGFVDVYDVSKDCRHPVFDSSTPLGVLGHESAFSTDGTIFYVSSTGGHTLAAVDLTDPTVPRLLWVTTSYSPHGMSVSDDGRRLYIADTGLPGLIILDVSGVNAHQLNPTVPVVSQLTWPEVSIPQNAIPFSEKGHPYLAEVDEYTKGTSSGGYNANASVGAARIIDIQDDTHPLVVSNMRLVVNQTASRAGNQQNDYGAMSPLQGYAGHYCNVPTRVDPKYVACSFIMSGLRVFNIEDLTHPYEMAYFNAPSTPVAPAYVGLNGGNFAMSAPTFDPSRNEIWYTDGFWGFYVVKLTPGAFSHAAPHPANMDPVAANLPNTTSGLPVAPVLLAATAALVAGSGLILLMGWTRRRRRG